MCLLAPRQPPLVSRFSGVSSTQGYVSFGIRATHHIEYGLECSMGYGSMVVISESSMVVISERATWEGPQALPQSESRYGRRLRSVVVC